MKQPTLEDTFGPIISSYSRDQALEDGLLIDASEIARQYGIKFPVALTAAVWVDCVEWTADTKNRKSAAHQDEIGRLRDVVCMMAMAARRGGERMLYQIVRVPVKGRGTMPRKVTLKAICGPGDTDEPVITIMMPEED